jgi:hypothetical protein
MSNNKKNPVSQSDQLLKSVIGETSGAYDKVVIHLTKENCDVIVKGAMNYTDIVAMEKLHAALPHEIIGMLFSALESELKEKTYEKLESNKITQNQK